jgi:PAS domain S-box-containing protein
MTVAILVSGLVVLALYAAHLRRSARRLERQAVARAGEVDEVTARLRSIIDSAVDGIIVIDERGQVEAFNLGAERLFGYAAADIIGRNVSLLMPSPYREEHDGYMRHYLATGEAKIIGAGRQVTGRRRDGSTFPLHLSVGEMRTGGARRFTGILHDLSARERIEEQLREQTALARIGEFAALIAHEVKNPLAGIRGAIQIIGARLPADGRDAGMVREIVSRIDALDALMKDLLVFARPPHPRPAPVDVAPLVALTADFLRQDPDLTGVDVTVTGSVPPLYADAEMLKIVFLNVLVNAAHAMGGQGGVAVDIRAADGQCHIAIKDTGPGIPPALRDKIFTPFFTTKRLGSGLGLPTARRLVEAHGGRIDVECPSTGGTTVTLRVPTRPGAAVVAP